jgi:hypothetical protein
MSLKEDAIYDPAEGAVTSIYMSLHAATPGSEHSSLQTTFSVLIAQGEDLYWSGADSPRVMGAQGWVAHQMTEADLRLFPSSSNMQAPDPEGAPLQFGFMTCVNGTREVRGASTRALVPDPVTEHVTANQRDFLRGRAPSSFLTTWGSVGPTPSLKAVLASDG